MNAIIKKKSLFVVLLLGLISCFLLAGCDSRVDSIKANSLINDDVFSLDIEADSIYLGGVSTYFITDLAKEDLKDVIAKDKNAKAELYDDMILITYKKADSNIVSYFTIEQNGENAFTLNVPNCIVNNEMVYAPAHLIKYGKLEKYNAKTITTNKMHSLNVEVQKFLSFYKDSNMYDIVENGNDIAIKLKSDIVVSEAEHQEIRHTKSEFTIRVDRESNTIMYLS